MNRTFASLITLLLMAFLMTGCWGEPRPAGMPKLYPASIVVTQEGTPLEGASVQLFPEDSANSQWGPGGMTDASGVAELRTNGKYPGAPLGSYKVVVTKHGFEPHPHPEWADLPESDPNRWKYLQIQEGLKAFELVETKYSLLKETPLRVEITAKEKTYPVDAGSKPKK